MKKIKPIGTPTIIEKKTIIEDVYDGLNITDIKQLTSPELLNDIYFGAINHKYFHNRDLNRPII